MDRPSQPFGNLPELSVSEISQQVKHTVETAFGRVRVRGEISRPSFAASGHIYMTLKDDRAVLDSVCWRGTAARLAVRPEDGMEVICTGRITTFPGRSKYQLIVEQLELAGEGALLKMLEDRRRRLQAEGLFDQERKRPLPYLPRVIGVVTSPTGAVIRDILHRLADRFPVHVLVWPVLVQGEGASGQIAAAIDGFNALGPASGGSVPRPDLLIVARGGGSLEDLWAFNEEEVVRAAAASSIPLISAVGHETDTTLIDFVSDKRAPTPTAAAEFAVPVRADLLAWMMESEARLFNAALRIVGERRTLLDALARNLGDPRSLIDSRAQTVDYLDQRLGAAVTRGFDRLSLLIARLADRLPRPEARLSDMGGALAVLEQRLVSAGRSRFRQNQSDLDRVASRIRPEILERVLAEREGHLTRCGSGFETGIDRLLDAMSIRLSALARLLQASSYERTLERGFALVRDASGAPVTKAAETREGQAVSLRFSDDEVPAVIGRIASKRSRRETPVDRRQENLF